MRVTTALSEGVGDTLRAPRMIVWIWLVNLAVALAGAAVMGHALRADLGSSTVADGLRGGLDMEWWSEFHDRAAGIGTTFRPTVVGAGAFFDNLETWLSVDLLATAPEVVALAGLYGVLWILFLGGVLTRYAHPNRILHFDRFLTEGAHFFLRFLRLAVLSALPYYGIYRLARWLFPRLEDATRDVTVERTVLLWNLAAAVLVALLLTGVRVVFDYARIATVLENRKSMLLASLRGLRFVLRQPVAATVVYYLPGLAGVVLLALYATLAPGAGQTTVLGITAAFLLGQLYLGARLVLKLAALGAETSLFRRTRRARGL